MILVGCVQPTQKSQAVGQPDDVTRVTDIIQKQAKDDGQTLSWSVGSSGSPSTSGNGFDCDPGSKTALVDLNNWLNYSNDAGKIALVSQAFAVCEFDSKLWNYFLASQIVDDNGVPMPTSVVNASAETIGNDIAGLSPSDQSAWTQYYIRSIYQTNGSIPTSSVTQ